MKKNVSNPDDTFDDKIDDIVASCLDFKNPRSFFLFAGAGSGKTRSLVKALAFLQEKFDRYLNLRGQKIAVITYTNAAAEEIQNRLRYESLVHVSTIHSFIWILIEGFSNDIKEWIRASLQSSIQELETKQQKSRSVPASEKRSREIESKKKRLANLKSIKKFTYNPNGDNVGKDSLNHAEVLKIGAEFLNEKDGLRSIFVYQFPILFIDESQDTNKGLMDAFLHVQQAFSKQFILGLFGDTMQRIYLDGKPDIAENLPKDWVMPMKSMNHRSKSRIVELINKIRSNIDNQVQRPRTDNDGGLVRLFVANPSSADKAALEKGISETMASITLDPNWRDSDSVKSLVLEHHMAAKRLGFNDFFEPLRQVDLLKTGLLDGTLPEVRFFSETILPLVDAQRAGNKFIVSAITKKYSPILNRKYLESEAKDREIVLKKVKEKLKELENLWVHRDNPTFLEVLSAIGQNDLFPVPAGLNPYITSTPDQSKEEDNTEDELYSAWSEALDTPFEQIRSYSAYVKGEASFDTHQGVKGLEFPRVMVVIDDDEARGFLFSYEKLFGVKKKSDTDIKNEREGKDTGILRTQRLFYVTCSRAEDSLAIVAYTSDPEKLKSNALSSGWFTENEIVLV